MTDLAAGFAFVEPLGRDNVIPSLIAHIETSKSPDRELITLLLSASAPVCGVFLGVEPAHFDSPEPAGRRIVVLRYCSGTVHAYEYGNGGDTTQFTCDQLSSLLRTIGFSMPPIGLITLPMREHGVAFRPMCDIHAFGIDMSIHHFVRA